jgi:hypothetical protein
MHRKPPPPRLPTALLLLLLATTTAPGSAATPATATTPPWPAAQRQAAVAACKDGVARNFDLVYLQRNGLAVLPAGFREKNAAVLARYTGSCDCLFAQIEKQWSFDYFAQHQAEWRPLINRLMAGVCAITPVKN